MKLRSVSQVSEGWQVGLVIDVTSVMNKVVQLSHLVSVSHLCIYVPLCFCYNTLSISCSVWSASPTAVAICLLFIYLFTSFKLVTFSNGYARKQKWIFFLNTVYKSWEKIKNVAGLARTCLQSSSHSSTESTVEID